MYRHRANYFDIFLVAVVLLLAAFGIVAIGSATRINIYGFGGENSDRCGLQSD